MKLYLLLAAIIVFAFFSNDFGLVDIQKTAIILAAAVDRTEEGYALTAQIAVPKGTDRTTGGTSSVNVEGNGKTVSDCVAQIYTETGWVPKLVFCDLVLLGEDTAREDALAALDYFLRNEYMPDSCKLAVCEGKAGDLLSSASAIDDTSSLAIEKLFSDAAKKSGRVQMISLREFAIASYGVSASGFIPFVRMKQQEGSGEAVPTAGNGQSGGESGASQTEMIYQAAETALFSGGKMVSLLSEEETFAFSLLKGNVFSGTITVENEGTPVSLTILKNKGGFSLEMKGAPKAKLMIRVRVRLYNRGEAVTIEDIAKSQPSEEILGLTQEKLFRSVSSLWERAIGHDCDLFELGKSLYRSSKSKYGEWKETLLSVVEPEIVIKVDPVK